MWAWILANYEGLLVFGAILGLLLGYWRSVVAYLQAKAAVRTAHAALEQATVATRTITQTQFRTGVELLGHSNHTVRLGGITVLTELMQRHPDEYHVRVMRLFASFLKHAPQHARSGRVDPDSPDTREIRDIINETGTEERELERLDHFDLEASLRHTHFPFRDGKIQFREQIPFVPQRVSNPPATIP